MGSKCFRPTKQRNEPVYVSILNKAFVEAETIYQQKKLSKQRLIEQIITNQNQKGNLKRLFDHLSFHQSKVIDAIKECNRRVSFDKTFSSVVIGSMFCTLLVRMIATRKLKLYQSSISDQRNVKPIQSKRNLLQSSHGLRNLIYQLQSYFFQLIIKILVYSKQKQIHSQVSQTLIKYTNACGDKIVAKKELKNILDLYLNVVFQKDINSINNKSFLPFFAYSLLLSKTKSQILTSQFIENHFQFILKIFFQLEKEKIFQNNCLESEEFSLFKDSIESIVKDFIVFSLQNKKIKENLLTQIMHESNSQRFMPQKMKKLQNLIREELSDYDREYFMMDWLGYMLRYIGKKMENENESIKQSLIQSIYEASIHVALGSYGSLKNISLFTENKANAIDAVHRWFQQNFLNLSKALKNYQTKIFQVLLLNLHNLYPQSHSDTQEVSDSAKRLLIFILENEPQKLKEMMMLLNRQLRRAKSKQLKRFQSQNMSWSRSSMGAGRFAFVIEDEAAQILWGNSMNFISEQSVKLGNEIRLSEQQAQQLFGPITKMTKQSLNTIYLIQLAAIGLRHIEDIKQDQHIKQLIQNFLINLLTLLKTSQNNQLQFEYLYKLSQKLKLLFQQLISLNYHIIYAFLNHSFLNLHNQLNDQQLNPQILITVICLAIVVEKHQPKPNQQRLQKLSLFQIDLLNLINSDEHTQKDLYDLYSENKELFDFSLRISANSEAFKHKALDNVKSTSNIAVQSHQSESMFQNSAVSSIFQISSSNPDVQFLNLYKIVIQS